MFTTRAVNANGTFESKKYRDFSRDEGTKTVSEWREFFADLTNHHLAQAGYAVTVDHRSYEEQKNGLEATKHEGPDATFLRRNGIDTEITLSNDLIKVRNAERLQSPQLIKGLEQEIILAENALSDLKNEHSNEKARHEKEQQEKELNKDRDRFSHYQNVYQRFANKYFTTRNAYDDEINKLNISKLEAKTDKWLEKNGCHIRNKKVYENGVLGKHVTEPAFIAEYIENKDKEDELRLKKDKELKAICIGYKIDFVIHELRRSAEILKCRGQELPISADENKKNSEQLSFFERVKNVFKSNEIEIHDIKNVDLVEKLIAETVKSAIRDLNYERNREINDKIINDFHKQRAEDEKNRLAREIEYKKEFAARLEREREMQKNYTPSQTKKSDKNDFEM